MGFYKKRRFEGVLERSILTVQTILDPTILIGLLLHLLV